jgi:hypothetical protein
MIGEVGELFRKRSESMTAPAPQEDATGRCTVKGRPHLGPREIITAALWPSLEAMVDIARGSLDRSPYLADLLAWHIDRPDLIRHPQLVLDFATAPLTDTGPEQPGTKTRHCTVRVHPVVAIELDRRAKEIGCARAVYTAGAVAERLGAPRSRITTKEEGLSLAM